MPRPDRFIIAAVLAVVLALALIVGATYELTTVVLPYDWSTAGR